MREFHFTETVWVQDRTFEVTGTYTQEYAGNYDNPPEPLEINIVETSQLFDDPEEEPWQSDDHEFQDIESFVDHYYDEFYDRIANALTDEYDERGGDGEHD